MKMKLTSTALALLPFGKVAAHESHSHMLMHNIEHLILLSLLLAPALLLVRPAIRRLAAARAR
ncbi:MAG: hypothetical protein R3179_00105 [Sedimenticolaceae bacterium]|nr:hypothetical protein [Sedimenticolaceae bacterium]